MLNTPGSLLLTTKPLRLWDVPELISSRTGGGNQIAPVDAGTPMFIVTTLPTSAFANWMFVVSEKHTGWAYASPSYYKVMDTTSMDADGQVHRKLNALSL